MATSDVSKRIAALNDLSSLATGIGRLAGWQRGLDQTVNWIGVLDHREMDASDDDASTAVSSGAAPDQRDLNVTAFCAVCAERSRRSRRR